MVQGKGLRHRCWFWLWGGSWPIQNGIFGHRDVNGVLMASTSAVYNSLRALSELIGGKEPGATSKGS